MQTARLKPQSRALQRDETRRQLLAAGLRVVANNGFAGATTAAIARETGKAHGTVFVHFKTRDELLTALVQEVGGAMAQYLADADDGAGAQSVEAVLDAHLAALAQREELYARMLGEAATLPLAARAQIFALQSGVAWRLRGSLERDASGGKSGAMDPVMLANSWIALTNHYVMNRDLFAPGASVIAAFGSAIKSHFLKVIYG